MRNRIALAVGFAVSIVLAGCGMDLSGRTPDAGELRRGAAAIGKYGCGACHTIAGISGAHGLVGPPLTGIGSRMYVAGVLRNTPENLARWIQDPKAVDDKTAMPALGVTAREAGDIAAYLGSLK